MSDAFDQGQLVYRLAFGLAHSLADRYRQSAAWRDTSPAVAARILAAVAGQLGRDRAEGVVGSRTEAGKIAWERLVSLEMTYHQRAQLCLLACGQRAPRRAGEPPPGP